WCVTCQFNKRGALSDAQVMADFAQRQVVLMRADWTRRDAAIGAELTRLGRSGVPVYALYKPGAATAAPQLLPEVLSVRTLREAIAQL
ncbi:MAG: thioredoxin family protein, partial [Aquincola sp.]|nr:thioredoxin family protein [Aquincola sp.]